MLNTLMLKYYPFTLTPPQHPSFQTPPLGSTTHWAVALQREDYMASLGPLTSEDIFVDLGSGRGAVVIQAEGVNMFQMKMTF